MGLASSKTESLLTIDLKWFHFTLWYAAILLLGYHTTFYGNHFHSSPIWRIQMLSWHIRLTHLFMFLHQDNPCFSMSIFQQNTQQTIVTGLSESVFSVCICSVCFFYLCHSDLFFWIALLYDYALDVPCYTYLLDFDFCLPGSVCNY